MSNKLLTCGTPGDERMPAAMPRSVPLDGNPSVVSESLESSRNKSSIRKAGKIFTRFFGKHKGSYVRPLSMIHQQTPSSDPQTVPVPSNVICARSKTGDIYNAPRLQASHGSTIDNDCNGQLGSAATSVEGPQDNAFEATTRFFGTPTDSCDELTSDQSFGDEATVNEASYTLESIRDRDVQLRVLRHCNQGQQRELETSRKLAKMYIEKNRALNAESNEWQKQVNKALPLIGHWRLEATEQAACAATLQHDLEEARTCAESNKTEIVVLTERCDLLDEEKAKVSDALTIAQGQYDAIKEENEALLTAIQELQARNATLESENSRVADCLEATRRDYEVLLGHKTAEYISDPALKEPLLIEPNELRDLQQSLEQSKRNHATEQNLHSHAFELAQQYKTEAARARQDNGLLSEKMEQLQTLFDRKCIVEDHHSAVKTLFAAGRLATSQSALAEKIEMLARQLTEDKISTEMLGDLMQQVSNLKGAAQQRERQHEDEVTALREEVKQHADEVLRRDSGDLRQALELGRARDDLDSAEERIVSLTAGRDYWKSQCVTTALGEREKALFESKENQLKFYKHLAQDQSKQLDGLAWDLVMMRDWARGEVEGVGMYLEQIDWHKAQVDALEAHFSEMLQSFPLQMPFRPVWKKLSEEERQAYLQKEAGVNDAGYDAYKRIREAYLDAELLDYELLAGNVVEDAPSLRERHAESMLETANEMPDPVAQPGLRANWSTVVPQLPSALCRSEGSQNDEVAEEGCEEDVELSNQTESSRDSWETLESGNAHYS